MRVEDDSSDVN